jgi:hypothetical protein
MPGDPAVDHDSSSSDELESGLRRPSFGQDRVATTVEADDEAAGELSGESRQHLSSPKRSGRDDDAPGAAGELLR